MRLIWLLVVLFPMVVLGQTKYSSAGKKFFKQATEAYVAGNVEAAIGFFEDCVDSDPNFAEAHLNLATIYYHRGYFEKSLECAQNAYAHNRYQPEVYVELGKSYFQNGYYDSSVVMLTRAVTEFNNTSDDVYLHLAKSLTRTGDNETALEFLEKILTKNPNHAAALNERGTAYYNLGDYENALADYNAALEQAPGEATIYSNLANLALATGDTIAVEENLAKAMETATSAEKINLLLMKGNIQASAGNLDEAEATFGEAFAIDESNVGVLVNQAALLISRDDYEKAWLKCNDALEIDNQSMEAYFNRGIANEMLRRTEDACLDWEQAFILGSEKAEEYLNSPACTE
jgi:tetratricopeptide (TPR) repeat protein